MAEAGFPPGTVNLVTGAGAEVGDAIVDSPDVPSSRSPARSATGKRIAERAGRRLKRLSPRARRQERRSSSWPTPTSTSRPTGSSGRRSGRPASAARPRARGSSSSGRSSSRCSQRLEARARTLRLGSGLDADDRRRAADQRRRRREGRVGYVDIGRGEGELVTGGGAGDATATSRTATSSSRRSSPASGRWTGSPRRRSSGRSCRSSRSPTTSAAVTALNQTRYGLSSSIFTRDVNTAFRAMRDFETGIVYVNAGTTGAETHLPFGGWKETGNGHREAGHAALDTFTEWKSIYVDFTGRLQRAQIDNQEPRARRCRQPARRRPACPSADLRASECWSSGTTRARPDSYRLPGSRCAGGLPAAPSRRPRPRGPRRDRRRARLSGWST